MTLNDPKEKDNIKEIMRQGMKDTFWNLIEQSIDQSIEAIMDTIDGDKLKELPADQYKVESEILKTKRNLLKYLKQLPESIIAYVETPNQTEQNFDPYSTANDLKVL